MTKLDKAKFRVKTKSLAAEARFIRLEERRARRARRPEDCNSLHLHRVGIVRTEARCTFLAYAYARGVPYSVAERSERKFNGGRVRDIIKTLTGQTVSLEVIAAWKSESLSKV